MKKLLPLLFLFVACGGKNAVTWADYPTAQVDFLKKNGEAFESVGKNHYGFDKAEAVKVTFPKGVVEKDDVASVHASKDCTGAALAKDEAKGVYTLTAPANGWNTISVKAKDPEKKYNYDGSAKKGQCAFVAAYYWFDPATVVTRVDGSANKGKVTVTWPAATDTMNYVDGKDFAALESFKLKAGSKDVNVELKDGKVKDPTAQLDLELANAEAGDDVSLAVKMSGGSYDLTFKVAHQ